MMICVSLVSNPGGSSESQNSVKSSSLVRGASLIAQEMNAAAL